MHCDQVFDILTQGPFPRGRADDAQVEGHLAECAECRRLALALRPAVTLFHETLSDDEAACLPGYWGDLLEGAPAASPQRAAAVGCDDAPLRAEPRAARAESSAGAESPARAESACDRPATARSEKPGIAKSSAAAPAVGVRAARNRLLRRTMAAFCLAAAGAAFLPIARSPEGPKLASGAPRFTSPAPRVVEGDLLWAAAGVPSCAATAPVEGWGFEEVPVDGPGAPLSAAAWRPQTVAFQGANRLPARIAKPPRAVVFAALAGTPGAKHPAPRGDAALLALYCCTHCHQESSPALLLASAPLPAGAADRTQACLLCHDSEP